MFDAFLQNFAAGLQDTLDDVSGHRGSYNNKSISSAASHGVSLQDTIFDVLDHSGSPSNISIASPASFDEIFEQCVCGSMSAMLAMVIIDKFGIDFVQENVTQNVFVSYFSTAPLGDAGDASVDDVLTSGSYCGVLLGSSVSYSKLCQYYIYHRDIPQ